MNTYVRPDVAQMLAMAAQNPRPTLRELGPVGARHAMRELGKVVDLPVGDLAVVKDFGVPRRDGGIIAARLFDARAKRGETNVVLYFHGGGFVFGDLDTHAPVCAEIARRLDLPVLAVDYRLAPEHPWPAAQDDCNDVAEWLSNGAQGLGLRPSGLVLCGDSAGGWLAVVAALALTEAGEKLPLVALGLIYPLIDMDCARYASFQECASGYTLTADGMNWFVECFKPNPADPIYDLSRCVRADLAPTVVISAGLDPLRDQGRAFAAALTQAGGAAMYLEARGQVHGFIGSRQAIASARGDLDDFLLMLSSAMAMTRSVANGRAHGGT